MEEEADSQIQTHEGHDRPFPISTPLAPHFLAGDRHGVNGQKYSDSELLIRLRISSTILLCEFESFRDFATGAEVCRRE